ncbi:MULTISPECIES: HAMP domain-containing protein [Paenibacillus]|uniref:HAMP domain-containing protein n=1 Tax=Paenibacillus TaxID=44249 RepID=UPI003988F415
MVPRYFNNQLNKLIAISSTLENLPLNQKSKDELYQLSETFNHMMERIETKYTETQRTLLPILKRH